MAQLVMEHISEFISESKSKESLVEEILNALDGDIVQAIVKRTKNYDENKMPWSREPMFLIAEKEQQSDDDATEKVSRTMSWKRISFMDLYADGSEYEVKGTIDDYNIKSDVGEYPCSVLGVYVDRQFLPICSIESFKRVVNILKRK